MPSSVRLVGLFPVAFILVVLGCVPACSSGNSARETSDAGVVASVEQAVTAQPDPSCKYARFGVHDYWICGTTRNFSAAKAMCEGVGMHLARIDNSAENDFVKGQLGGDSWIGATDSATEGNWRWLFENAQFWSGNRPGSAVGGLYNKWTSVEPNDLLGEDCGLMVKNTGEWNDIACTLARSFVCESSPATGGQPQAPDTACTRTTRNGATYWTCSNTRSWDAARANCQSVGTDLATIDDAAEGTFLAPSFTRDTHIGLNDRDEEGTWRWSATRRPAFCGTSGGRTPYGSYSNWNSAQPVRSNTCQKVESANRAYWVCSNEATWDAAKDECAGSGSSLARIDDAAENALIAGKITVDTWLGATDRAAETQWRWLDNTQFWSGHDNGTRVAGRYANFQVGEPNDLFGENCLLMYLGGKWNDSICEAPLGGIGFACEGPKKAGYPDRNDCAFAQSGGKWSAGRCDTARAYVCESVPADVNVTLDDLSARVREDHAIGSPRVMGFDVKAGVVIKEPFAGREERLGLRACEDSLEPSGTPQTVRSLNLERVTYDQKYGGVRVYGRGYTVLRNPTTKNVTSVLGEIAPDLAVATTPVFTESQSLSRATATVGRVPADFSPTPRGELVIFPKVMGKVPIWELSWIFYLRRTTGSIDQTVVVSAISGAVIQSSENTRTCASLGAVPSPAVQQLVTVNAEQAIQYSDPNQALATVTSATTFPTYLFSNGVSGSASVPVVSANCGAAVFPTVMRVGRSPITYGSAGAPTDEEVGAAMFLATQTSLKAFTTLFSTPSLPWLGVDGTGNQRIDLHIGPGISARRPNGTIHFSTEEPENGAGLDIAGHELGHSIWRNHVDWSVDVDLESRAVDEAFGDIMGAAVENVVRGTNNSQTGSFCMAGDSTNNVPGTCVMDFVQPIDSTSKACQVDDPQGNVFRWGCPQDYWGPDYCKLDNDCGPNGPITSTCCDEHTNATVFDHWYYLVSMGTPTAMNTAACTYTVQKLLPDPVASQKLASQIVFKTITDRRWNNLQFRGLAEATIATAESMGLTAAQVQSVKSAWYAVNVRENAFDSTVNVTPARGAKNVHPWVTFTWPAGPNETEWDFQLDDNDFAGPKMLYEVKVTTTMTVGTPPALLAYTAVALPENRASHYVWRVRKHSTLPWVDCQAIHWFDGTGPMTQPPLSVGNLDPNGLLLPGTRFVYFPQVPGVPSYKVPPSREPLFPALSGYKVRFSTDNLECADTPEDVPEPVETGETPNHAVGFSGTQPGTTYWATVQPLGPPQVGDKQPAKGPCVTFSASSGPPNKPIILQPANGQRFNLFSPHDRDPTTPGMLSKLELRWTVDSWMASSRVQFRKQLQDGTCGDLVQPEKTLPTPAGCTSSCIMSITEDLFPNPYPGGYCWSVSGIGSGQNPVESPAATGRWSYFVDVSTNRSPGVPAASGAAGAIDKAFGDPVPLNWDPVPSATEYYVKVWNFTSAYGTEQLGNPTVWEATVSGGQTTTTVPGSTTRSGRYCWELTPKLEDPTGNGQTAAGQPKVNAGGPICYTTQPALPKIFIDENKPPARGYIKADVKGRVVFDYIPDDQYLANAGSGWNWDPQTEPPCTTFNQVFKDIVGCTRRFTVPAEEGKTVMINVKAFNLPGAPGTRPTPKDKPLHDPTEPVKFGVCGGANEPCCPNRNCDDTKLNCTGAAGSDVCTPMVCGMTNGTCCGLPNQCLSTTDQCIGTTCTPKPPACGDLVQAGGNAPSQRSINLVAIKGTSRLTINTFKVPDNLVVSYGNKELVNTGCVFTGMTIDGCADFAGLGNYTGCSLESTTLVNNCWCCKSGACYTDIPYSGDTSLMTVTVNPACGPGGGTTEWNYSLACPR